MTTHEIDDIEDIDELSEIEVRAALKRVYLASTTMQAIGSLMRLPENSSAARTTGRITESCGRLIRHAISGELTDDIAGELRDVHKAALEEDLGPR